MPLIDRRLLLRLALLAGLSACGGQPQPGTAEAGRPVVSFAHLPGRECRLSPLRFVPDISELMDTAAVLDSLRRRGFAHRVDHAAFSIVYDRNGLVRQEVIHSSLPDTTRAHITRILDAHVRKEFKVDTALRYWGWQLRIDMMNEPQLAIGRQEFCEPQRRASAAVAHQANALARRLAGQPWTERDRVRLMVHVDELGRATAVLVSGSVSGAFDRYAADLVSSQPYYPMLIDRIPIESEFLDWFP